MSQRPLIPETNLIPQTPNLINMEVKSYKDLTVWQKAIDLAESIYRITALFPNEERFGLINQMRRCAVSISSNIAEGKGRNSLNDYIHFLYMARGSLFELETQLTLSKKLNFVEQSEEIEELINEVRKMLHALINKLKEINNNKV